MARMHPSIESLLNHIHNFSNNAVESEEWGGSLPDGESITEVACELADLIAKYQEGPEAAVALRKLLECLDAAARASDVSDPVG